MNYDIKISSQEPTDSIWAMITKEEMFAIEFNSDAVYEITFPKIKHLGLVVTGIKIREWSEVQQRFSCDIYYLMKK
jgi:hypothetical protein